MREEYGFGFTIVGNKLPTLRRVRNSLRTGIL